MKSRKILAFILGIIVLSTTLLGCANTSKDEPLSKTEFLMDTVINLKLYDKHDEKALEKAMERLIEIDDRTSSYIGDSDVNKINANAGIKPVQVNEDVHYLIERAKYFAEISDGAYEPTIGPLVDLWNITGANDEERESIPSQEEIEEKMELVDYKDLEILEDNQIYLKRKGMKLDLGGIAKGYAADEVKRIFKDHGVNSAIIDLGGNIYALGSKEDDQAWKIGIQDPFDVSGTYLGILDVKDKSVVTSGDYERYFNHKGKKYHHIIDSKTGYPSENEIAGISVISDSSTDGDALSTALFVLGIEEGRKLLENLDQVEGIFIDKNQEVNISKNLEDIFLLKNENLKLKINSR